METYIHRIKDVQLTKELNRHSDGHGGEELYHVAKLVITREVDPWNDEPQLDTDEIILFSLDSKDPFAAMPTLDEKQLAEVYQELDRETKQEAHDRETKTGA